MPNRPVTLAPAAQLVSVLAFTRTRAGMALDWTDIYWLGSTHRKIRCMVRMMFCANPETVCSDAVLQRLLIIAPSLLLLIGLQAYLWVPTYESQLRGNAARAQIYLEGSIGDAKFLNPILNTDASSSRITDLVFEGLLTLDEDQRLAPELARSWTLNEHIYLGIPPGVNLDEVLAKLHSARAAEPWGASVVALSTQPAQLRRIEVVTANADRTSETVTVEVQVPPTHTHRTKPRRSGFWRVRQRAAGSRLCRGMAPN